MWKEGHHRKAIQNLQGAIASNAFQTRDTVPVEVSVTTAVGQLQAPNKVKCHAQLLLAKWLDRSGQTKAHTLKDAYASGVMSYPRWDKGHYYLGRHYNKLLESEKQLPVNKQTATFAAGEYNKLVIENYVRSVVYGTKYYYQTIPKVLTLWLDMGMEVLNGPPRGSKDKEMYEHKVQYLEHINRHIKRYTNERMPTYSWYTAFPQIITRISHPHKSVWEVLQTIIVKVASQYPQQSLWSLLAVTKATQDDRRGRGLAVLQKLRAVSGQAGQANPRANKKKDTSKKKGHTLDLKTLIVHGQRLTDALLSACDQPVEQRVSHVSLSRDLNFNHKLAPCALVVPIEATMTANLPAGNDSKVIRTHNPFPQDAITISSFMDDVLVLSSLQRPRKVNVRGSDGRSYGLLCKPKDDLRKDQRLMEFNAMINRALTRDIESSKRRLYIKTYGVTPLNEECGTIEWVEGLKPMRDIIIRLYRQKGVAIDYGELRMLLNEACSDPSKTSIFTQRILKNFPAVLYEWFIETFPEPEAWFAARLRYTRSCAVMSIVGHVLGLGDRHGENVLLEEGNGGTFHVDFNCLFDKGLTFEKPELVPFRLTHNMVDAMGPSGIEGPFRTAAELTYTQLRQHQDTLITILETFVHDPTADFLGGKRRKKIAGVPDTPQEVLETVRGKVEGLMKGETVPLSVEGYVDALCQMARDPRNLSAMYIGWCAFF
jgi:serine/threonine-protein kinase ATR